MAIKANAMMAGRFIALFSHCASQASNNGSKVPSRQKFFRENRCPLKFEVVCGGGDLQIALRSMTSEPSQILSPPPHDLLNQASLFLDFDGTLVELAARHDAVTVELELRALIATLLKRLHGRLAIVSGRPASEIRNLFGAPIFLISGSHGSEYHWPDGRIIAPPAHDFAPSLTSRLDTLVAAHPGVVVERKPFGVALHYRLAPQSESACISLAEQLADETGLALQSGKMVIELKNAGADKGVAVERLMREPPMNGGRPIFIGDDATDEAGFAMAAKLGGAGVLVGATRPTAAAYRLTSVGETLAWLQAASGAEQ